MSSILETFYILFDSDASKLDKGIETVDKKATGLVDKLKAVDKTGTEAGQGLYKLLGQTAGLLGLGLSFGALLQGVKGVAEHHDELGKLAARFRDNADAVDEFLDSLQLLGIAEEKGVDSLKGLDNAIQDTVLGLGRAKAVFDELGLKVQDASGKIKPTTVFMGELAAKMSKLEKGTQIRIMDRLGLDPALLRLFATDMGDLQARMAAIDKATGANFEKALKRSQEYAKANKALGLEINTLRMFFEKLLEKFQVMALPWLTESLKATTAAVKGLVSYLLAHSKLVEGALIAIAGAILYFLVPAALSGAVAFLAMIAPIALIVAAVVAVGAAFALVYDDVMTFIEGGDSLIGRIVEWIKSIPLFTAAVEFIGAAFRAAQRAISQFIDDSPALRGAFDGLAAGARVFWEALKLVGELVVVIGKGIAWLVQGGASLLKLAAGKGIDLTTEALVNGKVMLDAAARSPISAQTPGSIANTFDRGSRSTTVQVDKIEVNTQATDAAGIAKSIGGTFEEQLRQTTSNYDDGILG